MNNKGFTLVEVLAVVAILAVLGLIAVPNVLNTLDNSKGASDKILYGNIKTSLQTLYEEIYYSGSIVNKYDSNGKIDDEVEIDKDNNKIETNIQTLVSNGFLSGLNNECEECENKNSKIIFNSDGEDIGGCEVSIIKSVNNGKVSYEFKGSDAPGCPTNSDLGE